MGGGVKGGGESKLLDLFIVVSQLTTDWRSGLSLYITSAAKGFPRYIYPGSRICHSEFQRSISSVHNYIRHLIDLGDIWEKFPTCAYEHAIIPSDPAVWLLLVPPYVVDQCVYEGISQSII